MKIQNRKAFFNYELKTRFEAGINLQGPEVKAVKEGHADLTGSFVKIIGSEAYLVNAKIFPYQFARFEEYDPKRTRKLLLHKKELLSLKSQTEGSNLTIVPVALYTKHRLIKLELALGKGKKRYEKKESMKQKDIQKEIDYDLASEYEAKS